MEFTISIYHNKHFKKIKVEQNKRKQKIDSFSHWFLSVTEFMTFNFNRILIVIVHCWPFTNLFSKFLKQTKNKQSGRSSNSCSLRCVFYLFWSPLGTKRREFIINTLKCFCIFLIVWAAFSSSVFTISWRKENISFSFFHQLFLSREKLGCWKPSLYLN